MENRSGQNSVAGKIMATSIRGKQEQPVSEIWRAAALGFHGQRNGALQQGISSRKKKRHLIQQGCNSSRAELK